MLTYDLKKSPGVPLYEALYRCIREDILAGTLQTGQKLPSKRALADNLEVSKITVEAAYQQLLAEGYIRSQEKVGYFVEAVAQRHRVRETDAGSREAPRQYLLDLTGNATEQFPFSVWTKLQREVILDYGSALLEPLPNQGVEPLRKAIADHLAAFRGMLVHPDNILIGAGTDFLCNLLMQLLGLDRIYAVEEPGYGKIRKIYSAGGARCVSALLDSQGVRPDTLTHADVLHFSPSHHFPTGLVTPVSRRMELLSWAQQGKWIIEDDYDSEFRFDAHPKPTMQSLDRDGRVIYMNTFSKTLAPSIRISYMVLPTSLMEQFRRKLGFYSCTVPSFEQYTLARFLQRGYFEKHINRMRKVYKTRRNNLIAMLAGSNIASRITIREEDAGLHFLLKVDTALTDRELVERLDALGIRVRTLGEYYHDCPRDQQCLVINYSGVREENLRLALTALDEIM